MKTQGIANKKLAAKGKRFCPRCQSVKPLSSFPMKGPKYYKDHGGDGSVRYGYCKDCHRKCQDGYKRSRGLLIKYGITGEEYDLVLKYQDGGCAICGRPPGTKRLAVDHRHVDGLTRGLLCWQCNKAIAYLKDSLARAKAMYAYLKLPPVTMALGEERFGRTGRTSRKWRTKREKREYMVKLEARLKKEKEFWSR